MHTVWKGAISFGLVNVPVKMFSATEDKDISFRQIHQKCGSPIIYAKSCPVCHEEVAFDDIVKGYEYEKGKFVTFAKEELEQFAGEANKEIRIIDFVRLADIDPIYFQKTYYLAPGETGANAYSLLMRALQQSQKIGIAKIFIRSKSSLAAIRVIENCIALETCLYPDEIRPVSQVPNLPQQPTLNEKELQLALMLIDQLTTAFEPEKYKDDKREQMLAAIAKKVAGEEITVAPEAKRPNVIDLMSALQASLEMVKTDPGDETNPAASSAANSVRPAASSATNAAAGAVANAATGAKTAPAKEPVAAGGRRGRKKASL
ncbi:MAG TPA: Ku protein [Bacilli bacterium]